MEAVGEVIMYCCCPTSQGPWTCIIDAEEYVDPDTDVYCYTELWWAYTNDPCPAASTAKNSGCCTK